MFFASQLCLCNTSYMRKDSSGNHFKSLEHLPYTNRASQQLEPKAALAAFFVLRRINPNLYTTMQAAITNAQDSIASKLNHLQDAEGQFRIGEAVLHGIIAQSVIAGTSETALQISEALQEISLLESEIEQGEVEHPFESDD